MRALGLGVCTVAALVSLRPVSDLFREQEHAAVANAFIETPANPPPKTSQAFAPRIGATSAMSLTADSAIKPREAGRDGASAASLPGGEEERIVAVKKELKRLGLYNGPMTPVWGEDARKAARKFTRVNSKPSQRLLADLHAANAVPARSSESGAEQSTNRKVRRKLAEAPAAAIPAPADGLVSDGYLPPWPMLRGRELKTAQRRSLDEGGSAARESARLARVHRRKSEAAIRLASARRTRRNMLADAAFFWPGL
ncbi:MAG: putative peptidoglycan binding domain-containing protein [Rhodomicrobium sp.]